LRDATLVALTGYGDDANRRRSRHAGIDLHLVKPVDPGRLRDLLSAMAAERAFPQGGEGVGCPTVSV
jgi:CheY-like chemotaxis protein